MVLATLAPGGASAQDADEEYVLPLVNQALETEKTGVERPWLNVATGNSGVVVIERTFYRDPRTPCRDYYRTVERTGTGTVTVRGTGCRVGPNRWSLDEEEPETTSAGPPAATPPPAADPPPEPETERAEREDSCPPVAAVRVPCGKPPAFVDYTMPPRTEL